MHSHEVTDKGSVIKRKVLILVLMEDALALPKRLGVMRYHLES